MIVKKLFNQIMLGLNVLLAFILILVYLSIYINPSKFWPAPFLGLMYPYILLINIIFVFYWAFSWNKYILISLFVIILGWKHIKTNYRYKSSKKTELVKNGLKILSYNIQMKDLSKNYLKDEDKSNIIKLIENESPDVICFQEMFCTYGKPIIVPVPLQKEFRLENCNIQRGNKYTNYGIGILSKYKSIDKGTIRFNNSTNFCMYNDIVVNGDTVRIYNAHLQSVGFMQHDFVMIDSLAEINNNNRLRHAQNISHKLKDAYIKRSEQVNILEKHIKNCRYKVIVCGDFNDTPVSYTYNVMQNILKDAYKEAGNGSGNTYIGKIPSYRIDYIFYDERIETAVFRRPKIKSSDHFPVTALIDLK